MPQENQTLPVSTSTIPPTTNQSPQQATIYAGFWIRWSAYIIDLFVAVIPSALIGALVSLPIALASKLPLGEAYNASPTSIVFNGVTVILVWTYFVYMTSKQGATLGKSALKLKVVSEDGTPITFKKAIMREVVGKIVSGLIFAIGYLLAAFSSKKQALHDHIAGTYVIQTKPATGITKLIVFLTIFAPIIPFILMAIIFFGVLFALLGAKGKTATHSTIPLESPQINQHTTSPSSTQQSLFNPNTNTYSVAIETDGCKELSCVVFTEDNLTGSIKIFNSPNLKTVTPYDVYVCTPNCGTGTKIQYWDPKKCWATTSSQLTIEFLRDTCF